MRALVLAVPFVVASCGYAVTSSPADSGARADSALVDAGPTVDHSVPIYPGPPRTYDYVINRFIIDPAIEPPGDVGIHGFNLDGRYSPSPAALQLPTDCDHGDNFSVLDPDQNTGACHDRNTGGGPSCGGGVDNQLPHVANVLRQARKLDLQRALDDEMRRGRGLMILRVSGVDRDIGPGFNDPSVIVALYPYVVPTFADCADVARPRQRYTVDDRALYTPGDLSTARLTFFGSIVDGRLRVNPAAGDAAPRFRLAIPIANALTTFDLRETRLRVTLGEAEATSGNLGGYVPQDELFDALDPLLPHMMHVDALRPLIQGFTDVATGTSTPSCVHPSGGIGMGLGFTAVRAVVAPTTVSGPVSGVCGSAP
jgi:hypothetical protein